MKFYKTGEELCKDMNIPLSTLEATHQIHFEAAKKQEKDPNGGPFEAYPSGKTWDEPSGKTGVGKKFFHNIIDGSKVKTEPFYSAPWKEKLQLTVAPTCTSCVVVAGSDCVVTAKWLCSG